jgi:hypothetical protein
MIRCRAILALGIALLLSAELGLPAADHGGDPVEGARIAADLKAMRPATNAQWTGVLKRRLPTRTTIEVPVACHIFIETNRWLSVYNSSATTNAPAEKLVVIRYFDGRTEYLYGRAAAGAELPTQPVRLDGAAAGKPFAGSDFLLSDLGLEFLQWPTQLLQPGEMRRGQPCFVLDSLNPNPVGGGYARVRSWIQKEHLGLLIAEAYDADGRLVKEFTAGSFVKDAAGNYQLKDMDIRSVREKSRTELEFDVVR